MKRSSLSIDYLRFGLLFLIIFLFQTCDRDYLFDFKFNELSNNNRLFYKGKKILYVDDDVADCFGVYPQNCLLVKETPNEDWGLFYDEIEGFDYELGYNYKIRVLVFEWEKPMMDASAFIYKLEKVIDKY